MKKKLFFAAVAIVALASCADNEFVGEVSPNPNPGNDGTNAIVFNSGAKTVTRSGEIYGAAAASLLNRNFVVEGIKTVSVTENNATTTKTVEVFDNYNVNWTDNTANTTASNTANWEYVGQTIIGDNKTQATEQSIKYWDFAASQYDFWAYSLGGGNASVISLAHNATLGTQAYTITGNKTDLSKVYISDLQTAYNPVNSVSGLGDNVTPPFVMGNEVNLTFRSLVTKVRVGLYETIPGYSVKKVMFYPSDDANATSTNVATLFASSNVLPSFPANNGTSTYTVTFPNIGKSKIGNSDYNRAHVTFDTNGTKASSLEFGQLSYGANNGNELTEGNYWLRINSAQPTWAVESGATAGDYAIVIPYETGAVLTLKVDYTLESTDHSGEEITVHGAKALLPSQFTQWKPNYAYTYLFKISDNTNGLTNTLNADKVGLYPITLDAIVIAPEDGTQETITTVATPSITTYSLTSNVTTNNEYTTSDEIYVTATTNGELLSMTDKANLYRITKVENNADVAYGATEAEVMDALTTYSALSTGTYTGRNGIKLTPISSGSNGDWNLTEQSIPLIDGNTVAVTAGQVAKINKDKLIAGNYYAFVYEVTAPAQGEPQTKYEYSIATIDGTTVDGYYISNDGGQTFVAASGEKQPNTIYYTQNTGYYVTTGVYAIKVIKIKSN